MYGELPCLDDFLAIQEAHGQTPDPCLQRQYLKQTERMFDDLLGFAQKHALAGYDMREWRRRLFVPFDAEYNRLVTNYCEAIEFAQSGVVGRRKVAKLLEQTRERRRRMENAYYRELLDG